MLEKLHLRQEFPVASDTKGSVTYIPDLVHASLDLILDEEHGLIHLTNQGGGSWTDIARNLVRTASRYQGALDDSLIIEKPMAEFHLPAKRPLNSVLSSERLRILPEIESAMDRYFWELNIS
jgi:dTDP-4-dehydrorhamnose reductase